MEYLIWPTPNLKTHPLPPIHQDGNFFDHGDVLIHGLWENQITCVIDVRVTDTNQPSYLLSLPSKIIANQEMEKKKKYLDACLQQQGHFSPFVVDVYESLGTEVKAINKCLDDQLTSRELYTQLLVGSSTHG